MCRKGALGTRRLSRVLGKDKVEIVPDLTKRTAHVRSLAPDLVVSWFWTKKVPAAFRATSKLGAVGVHPSLLPRHRGPDPYFWAIDAGDEITGVSAHELEDEYDTGAVLGQRSLRIDPSWNAWRLAKRLDRPSLALLRETVAAFAKGEPPKPIVQDESQATDAPQPSDEDLELRWTDDTASIVRRVRAASPWPGAFSEIGDEILVLTRVRATSDYPRSLTPGQAFVRKDGVAIVRTSDAAVELLEGRFDDADDDTPALDAAALAEVVDAARDIEE